MRRVALIIAKRDGLVLFGKRRDTGKYTLPGGHLEEGEEPVVGARRELKEETGLAPAGELKLVDERELRGCQFYTFECEVDGVPTGKDDPDQECGVWSFHDIADGVPKDMASNMAGPKEPEKNVVLDKYGLAKLEWKTSQELADKQYRHDRSDHAIYPGAKLTQIPVDDLDYVDFDNTHTHDWKGGPKHIGSIADAMKAGTAIPPAMVATLPNGKRWVVDGNHRVAAAKRLGLKQIPAWVHNGEPYTESLDKMALGDIPKGDMFATPPFSTRPSIYTQAYDYSHVLTPEHRAKGYKIAVNHTPSSGVIYAQLLHPGTPNDNVGYTHGILGAKGTFKVKDANVNDGHRGQHLGFHLYEAMLAHAKHSGAKAVAGDVHSTLASATHRRLAAKHGLKYEAGPSAFLTHSLRPGNRPLEPGDYDGRYGKYRYALKGEVRFSKAEMDQFDEFGEPMEKMQRIPGFAKLGIEDRRETPYIDSPNDYRRKGHQIAWSLKDSIKLKPGMQWQYPGEKHDVSLGLADQELRQAGGAVHTDPRANVSFVHSNATANAVQPGRPLSNTTDVATKLHEDFHQMMRRVEMTHGQQARFNLAHNLWHSVPIEQRKHAQQFASMFNSYLGHDHPLANEENLAILHNYVNDPVERQQYHKNLKHDEVRSREHQTGISRAFRQMIQNAGNADASWMLYKKFGPGANEPQGTKPGGFVAPPAPVRPQPGQQPAPKPKKPKSNPGQLDLFKSPCGWWNAAAYGEQLAKSIKHDDEVDRLLMHPNPIERRMALKMDGVDEKHLVRAFADEDPEVQTSAIRHPQLGHHGLLALMQMPSREHLQLVGLHHPAAGREHLEALYHTHKHLPMSEKATVLKAISNHHALDGGLIEQMYDDGNGARAIDSLHTPPSVIRHAIEEHFLNPEDMGKKAIARRALKHPHAPTDLVHEAFENGPMDVKLSVAMGPHLDEPKAQDVMQRGQLPAYDHEAALRGAIIGNERASKRHLETATKDRNAIVRQHAQRKLGQFGKFEADMAKFLGTQLAKATRPEDFRAIVKATENSGGPELVDHKREAGEHPPGHNHDVEVYKQTVLDSPEPVKRLSTVAAKDLGVKAGITRKIVYQVPDHHPTHGGAKFLVKPYHERPVTRLKSWAKNPHQGWAEMTNQALYHAAGIGDAHQRVHVSEHNMGEGHEADPALVVRMEKAVPVGSMIYPSPNLYADPKVHEDTRKVALMDFLSNNLDRHGGNLLLGGHKMHPDTQQMMPDRVTAIDHSRSFQYQNTYGAKWAARKRQPREMHDRFGDYVDRSIIKYVAPIRHPLAAPDDYKALKNWAPAFDWWGQNSDKVREAFTKRLDLIKDPETRGHLERNFNERANWLDDRAQHGLENFGTDWYNDKVRTYRPGELTDDELEQRRHTNGPLFNEANR